MTERYKEYLKSAEWLHLKALKLKKANYICEGCGEQYIVLEVHHTTYERIGMELLTDLQVLCIECHRITHDRESKSDWHKYIKFITDEKPKKRLVQDIEMDKIINSI